jgi:hypothetical protein
MPNHPPAVTADMGKFAAFRRASLVKKHGAGLELRISSAHSHRWNKARRRHLILTYFSPQGFLKEANAGATGYFFVYFKTF